MIRAATTDDVAEVAALWVTAQPYRVITAAGLLSSYQRRDPGVVVSHQVAVQDGRVLGEVGLRLSTDEQGPRARISLVVHPEVRRRGVGTGLLGAASAAARAHGATLLHGIADTGPGLAFAEAHGARRERPHTVNGCDPSAAPPPDPTPPGLRVVRGDELRDLEPVRDLFNATAPDDPSGLSEQMSEAEFTQLWHAPDHRPELGAVVLADDRPLAVTSTLADLERGVAWTGMTATSPQARGQGLARLVKAHALRAMAAAGIRQVATGNDDANAAMLAVNLRLGYAPLATVWSVALPL